MAFITVAKQVSLIISDVFVTPVVTKIVNSDEVSRYNVNKSSLIIIQGKVGIVYNIKGYFLGLLLREVITMLLISFYCHAWSHPTLAFLHTRPNKV